jgi:protein disulfide-isomerase A6
MKPAWDQLAEAFKDSKTAVIVDVDCTKDNSKDLCSKYGVRGYPTIKYITESTDPMGDDYNGGRDFDSLKAFADENLGPSCSPDNLDLCSDEQKETIAGYQAQNIDDLKAEIAEKEKAAADAEAHFKAEVQKLQEKYQQLMSEKDDAVAAAKVDSLLRAVVNAAGKSGSAKDEL